MLLLCVTLVQHNKDCFFPQKLPFKLSTLKTDPVETKATGTCFKLQPWWSIRVVQCESRLAHNQSSALHIFPFFCLSLSTTYHPFPCYVALFAPSFFFSPYSTSQNPLFFSNLLIIRTEGHGPPPDGAVISTMMSHFPTADHMPWISFLGKMNYHNACSWFVYVFAHSTLWLQRDSAERYDFFTRIPQRVSGFTGLPVAHHSAARPRRVHQLYTAPDRACNRLHCRVVSARHWSHSSKKHRAKFLFLPQKTLWGTLCFLRHELIWGEDEEICKMKLLWGLGLQQIVDQIQ